MHLREEKTGLKANPRFKKIVLFVFFSAEIFAQIPFNGFCKYDSYPFPAGYQSAFTLNFNNDFYTDIILHSPDGEKIFSMNGEVSGLLKEGTVSRLPFPITKLTALTDENNNVVDYLFLSRKARSFGIIKFDGNGRGNVTYKLNLDSYPGNSSVANIDDDNNKEVLISGPSFNGLSILKKSGNKYTETKLFEKKAFSFASFIDINNDGYPDIAAFDLIENTLLFFYNNSRGEFRYVKSIPFFVTVKQMQVFDYNLDSFQDIIISTADGIKILLGDGVASYSNEIFIKTKLPADKLIRGDFNRDGKIDIVYLNHNESTVSVIFGKDQGAVYQEIQYLKKETVTDIIPYYSRFVSGFAAIDNNGFVYTITRVASLSPGVEITFGDNPAIVGSFDFSNNGIIDLFYIDNINKKSNFIIRDGNGIPSVFYSISLYDSYSSVKVDDSGKFVKAFYFYTTAKKAVEILIIDFNNFDVKREYIYTGGEISDLKVLKYDESPKADIVIANLPGGTLNLSEYSYKDFRYTVKTSTGIADSVFDAKLDDSLNIYFWRKFTNNITLYFYPIKSTHGQERLFSTRLVEGMKLKNYFFNFKEKGNGSLFSVIDADGETYLLTSGIGIQNKTTRESITKYFKTITAGSIYINDYENGKEKKMFLYLPEEKSLNKVEFTLKGGIQAITKLTDMTNAESFIVGKFSAGNYYVVYSNNANASLVIKKI